MSQPYRRGGLIALASALAFGLAAPLVKRFGAGVGPATTAALLYGGAALASLPALRRGRAALPRAAELPLLLAIALAGAVLAPICLAWGLQRTSAVGGSLLLTAEAPFTVLLAVALYREHLGRRMAAAIGLTIAGGALVALGGGDAGGLALSRGAIAVALAALLWAIDNTLTRRLADRDPTALVLAKATLGALASAALGVALGELRPALAPTVALVACGALGYGLSLRLYVTAQRLLGAGRTGSIFASGPFLGAAFAPLLGAPLPPLAVWASGGLFALAVTLHLTERHGHRHAHPALDHDHLHRHDDAHHDHVHLPPVVGEHRHPHHHDALAHDHEHAPDLHHQHEH